jgi:glycosyltransferase involved in cell wall biosynthesis
MPSPHSTPTGLVSVVIPTHDRRAFLSRAVQSVVQQTHKPLEILIVDDASPTPVEPSWFAPMPDQVSLRVLRHPHSRGPAAARNAGITASAGAWIAFLDDDDYWEPTKIAVQFAALRRSTNPDLLATACQMTLVDEHQRTTGHTDFPTIKSEIIAGMVFADRNLNPSTLLVSKYAFTEVGPFEPALPTAEDRQWLLRYLIRFDIQVINQYLTNYTQHRGPSLTSNFDAMLKGEESFADFIRNHTAQLGVNHRRAMAYRFAKLGNEYMLARRWGEGLKHFIKGLGNSPTEYRAWAGLIAGIFGPQLYRQILALRMARVRLASS